MNKHHLCKRLITVFLGMAIFWSPLIATGLEYFEEADILKPNMGIMLSPELKNTKNEEAKRGEWAVIVGLAEQMGFTSNLYHSPTDDGLGTVLPVKTVGSAFAATSILVETERHFNARNGLNLSFQFADLRYFENNMAYDQTVKLKAGYSHDFSDSLLLFADLGYKFRNDDALNIYGIPYQRDYSYAKYLVKLGARFDVRDQHRFKFYYKFAYKDYGEEHIVPLTNSLDWSRHGAYFRYRFMPHPSTKIRFWYSFKMQEYLEEKASRSDGRTFVNDPMEKHNYHKILVWVSHEANDSLTIGAKYRMRSKDDTYQSYESYVQHGGELMVKYQATLLLTLELAAGLNARAYDYRGAVQIIPVPAGTATMTNDKWFVDLTTTYQLDEYRTLFGGYALRTRSTNRLVGTSFMDYAVHCVGAGISMAF